MTQKRWTPAVGTRHASLAIFALAMLLLAACNANSISTSKTVTRHAATSFALTGQVPAVIAQAQDAGPLDTQKTLSLSIAIPLSSKQQAQLRSELALIYDPSSFDYHNFLHPSDFQPGGKYGLSSSTLDEVKSYLSASGLTYTSQAGQFINVQGSVADIESAFQVNLRWYNNKQEYGPAKDSNPSVKDKSLAGLIQSISGLDSFSHYKQANPLTISASGSGYNAKQIEKAYGLDSLISQGIDGSGQGIAFLELSDYQQSDIQQYQQENSLAAGPAPQKVQVDGGASVDAGTPEVELDMELASATAPKAQQYIYEGPNSGQGINDVYSQIVNDDKAKVVSISWGLCEQDTGSAELQTLDQIFTQGAGEGIAFFAAAGDSGAYDCSGDTSGSGGSGGGNSGSSNTLAVDSPADDPYVTGVGGTSLTLNNGGYGSEKAWSCTSGSCAGSGGGGGVSSAFALPTYQQGLNPSGANDTSHRFVPDVSADADPQHGYSIYCSAGPQDCQGDLVVGGTSGAAPVWAGSAALINSYLSKQGKQALGNANPALYAVAKTQGAFHDVTSGDNLHYQAGQGYDLATGLGSPNVANLAQAIASGNTGGGSGTPPTSTPTPGSGNGGSNTPTPTSGGGGTSGGASLITNGGFENGTDPWLESSGGQYELIDSENPHQGNYNADFCGYASCKDIVAQEFVAPSGSVNISYYWYMVTDKHSACSDHFTASIATVTDNGDGTISLTPITQVQSVCDTNANNAYSKVSKTVDLSSVSGQTVAIVFKGTTDSDGQNTTRMFVDDVAVNG